MPAAGSILIFCVLEARSAIDNVIFLCVWLAVECGLNVSFSLKTACACKPVPFSFWTTEVRKDVHISVEVAKRRFVGILDEKKLRCLRHSTLEW